MQGCRYLHIFILNPPQKLPVNLSAELGLTYLSKAEKNNYNRTLPLFAPPDFEVWHKLHRDEIHGPKGNLQTNWHCSVRTNPEMTASQLQLKTL